MLFVKQAGQQEPHIVTWLAVAERSRQHSRHLAGLAVGCACTSAAVGILTPLLGLLPVLPPVTGALASIATILLDRARSKTNYRTAQVKDCIDSALYGLPRSLLNGAEVTAEEMASVGQIPADDRSRYSNWYPIVDQLPQGYRSVLWQRSSAVWDIRLREIATVVALVISAVALVGSVVVAYVLGLAVPQYVTSVLLPLLPLVLTTLQGGLRNSDAATARKEIRGLIDSLWENAVAKRLTDIDATTVYVLKDYILQARRAAPPVTRVLEVLSHRRMYRRTQQSASVMQDAYVRALSESREM